MFGIKSAPPPGAAAVRELCKGWRDFTNEEKQAVAELLVRLVPSLAAQGDRASALPVVKIRGALGAAFRAAWVGILTPSKLLEQIAAALETDPAAEDLRQFCLGVAERGRAAVPPAPATVAVSPALRLVQAQPVVTYAELFGKTP
jgi:hypothetical protein